MAVIINGRDLTIEQVISVCRHHEKVELAPEAVEAVKKARAYVEKKVAEKAVVYGPVSYTHLDVYKRQGLYEMQMCEKIARGFF